MQSPAIRCRVYDEQAQTFSQAWITSGFFNFKHPRACSRKDSGLCLTSDSGSARNDSRVLRAILKIKFFAFKMKNLKITSNPMRFQIVEMERSLNAY